MTYIFGSVVFGIISALALVFVALLMGVAVAIIERRAGHSMSIYAYIAISALVTFFSVYLDVVDPDVAVAAASDACIVGVLTWLFVRYFRRD